MKGAPVAFPLQRKNRILFLFIPPGKGMTDEEVKRASAAGKAKSLALTLTKSVETAENKLDRFFSTGRLDSRHESTILLSYR